MSEPRVPLPPQISAATRITVSSPLDHSRSSRSPFASKLNRARFAMEVAVDDVVRQERPEGVKGALNPGVRIVKPAQREGIFAQRI
jgi:hypothetical protein